jgi:hypothetical protein
MLRTERVSTYFFEESGMSVKIPEAVGIDDGFESTPGTKISMRR